MFDVVSRLSIYSISCDVETNGTQPVYSIPFRAVSLSPKIPRSECKLDYATSLKILYPYLPGVDAKDWVSFPAEYKCLQLLDPEGLNPAAVAMAQTEIETRLDPTWRIGIQMHKYLGIA
jgi:organic radical activating enzyme